MPSRTANPSRSAGKSSDRPAKAPRKKAKAVPDTDEKRAAQATRVLRRFRVIFNAVKNHFRSVERTAGVSGAQLWAISVINATPGAGVNELARAMDLHQSTASNLVRSLAEAGMVVSAREGEDRRAVQLYLTTKAQKVLARAPGPFTGVLPEALMHLDQQTLARLDRDLATVIQVLDPAAHGRNVPLGVSSS